MLNCANRSFTALAERFASGSVLLAATFALAVADADGGGTDGPEGAELAPVDEALAIGAGFASHPSIAIAANPQSLMGRSQRRD